MINRSHLLMASLAMVLATPLMAHAADCAALADLTLPDVRITSAEARAAGPFTPPGSRSGRALELPAFCRVQAVATPTPESEIHFEVWLPTEADWNGRMLGTGNGGYTGAIQYGALANGLRQGFVTASNDTGHTGSDLSFGFEHREKIEDWAHRAAHVSGEAAKPLARARYGRLPHHAYFSGCSTGGHQALSQAQRYPGGYDGILAGAPAHNRTRLNAGFLWSWLALHDDSGAPLLSADELALVSRTMVESCDDRDGVKDGVVDAPRRCGFDPDVLRCQDGDSGECLSAVQVEALQKVYAGPRNPRTGEAIFTGWPAGSEAPPAGGGWATYLVAPAQPMRLDYWGRWVFGDPNWDYRTFDWDHDLAYAEERLKIVDSTDAELREFRQRGGKLLMYAGWADAVVPPGDTVEYFEALRRAAGSADAVGAYARLFMAPGMAHCRGGTGPDSFDALGALVRWVEEGVAPDQLIASKVVDGDVERTRPLCPYPQVARYTGSGSTDAAENFRCALPED